MNTPTIRRRGKMEKTYDAEEAFKNAVVNGRVKLSQTTAHCIFCDAKRSCISWVPERMHQVLPICEECFAALSGAFKKLAGGFVWR